MARGIGNFKKFKKIKNIFKLKGNRSKEKHNR